MTPAQIVRSRSKTSVFSASVAATRSPDLTPYSAGDVVGRLAIRDLTSISNASPGVCTLVDHGYSDGDSLTLTTSGALPAGLATGTTYYVVNATSDTFELSLTAGGTSIDTTDAGSGTHTANPIGGAVLSITGLTQGAPVKLRQSLLTFDLAAVPAGMTSFRLHLFSQSPSSDLADNEAWALSAADLAVYLGYVDLGTPVDVGPVLVVQASSIDRVVIPRSTELFGYLVTTAGYTPADGTTATIRLVATELEG